jgi:hypothetical protein
MGRRVNSGGKRRAVRNALGRLGLHAGDGQVVRELERQGVSVSGELVRAVRVEMLKETAELRRQRAALPNRPDPAVRHRPQKRPPRRG